MARPGKPWWWARRKCWAATIDGDRKSAPKSIGRKEEGRAWAWYEAARAGGAAMPDAGTVQAICEAYVQWDLSRVHAGDRDAKAHYSCRIKAERVGNARVAGERFGDLDVATVRHDHMGGLLAAWKAEGLSPGYRRELCILAKTIFRWAARPVDGRDRLIPESPFAGAKPPPAPPPAERYATRAEAARWLRWLWRSGRRDFALLQRCLIHTGARPSEVARASWGEVRWGEGGEGMAVLVRKQWKSARRTGKVRRVYIPGRLHRMLLRRRGEPDARLFVSPRGLPWTSNNLGTTTSRLRDEAVDAGVDLPKEGPDRLTCYRWRHTAASTLLMAGVPVSTVAELLGTSVQMIERTYKHLLSSHLADAASLLSRGRS